MAQVGIREFDAKRMFYDYIGKKYGGIQVLQIEDLDKLAPEKKYVIKPDMLFGKRGKYGLVGVDLDKSELQTWFKQKHNSKQTIESVDGVLDVFLVERFIPHEREYYISFSSQRESDTICFSSTGGINIEDNWGSVEKIEIGVLDVLQKSDLDVLGVDEKIVGVIMDLWNYYREYGFVYLEVNPFCFDGNSGEVVLLDMVAKIDDQEFFRQKHHWKDLETPNTYGFLENSAERYIAELDKQTGASLKMKILNPQAQIWTLLAGGGGSLVITDSLGALGYASQIGNYGELSGDPNREFTREYTKTLIGEMLKSQATDKYFIIAGAIANFTRIDTTFSGIIDVLENTKNEFKKQNITILVRRGGLNEKLGLELMENACKKMGIPITVADSTQYMTDILKNIKI